MSKTEKQKTPVKNTAKVTITVPAKCVFAYLTNTNCHHLWNPALQSVTKISHLKIGDRYTSVSLLLGVTIRSRNEVTKLTKDRELEISNNTGLLRYQVRYSLTSNKNTTVLTCNTSVSADSNAFAFAKPVLKLLAQRELRSDLQALKLAVEQDLAAA